MKKFLVSFICIGLLSGSFAHALSPKDLWKCRPSAPASSCTEAQKKEAVKVWATTGGIALAALVAAIATVLGIKVTADQQKKEAQAALEIQKRSDVRTQAMADAEQAQRKQQELERLSKAAEEVKKSVASINEERKEQEKREAEIRKQYEKAGMQYD